ncbi:MAG: hypothetical protein AAFP19_04810, partial [Bacteroidota bacterium]
MNLSKTIKRLFLFLFTLILLLIITAVAIPYFFKDELLQRLKTEINKTINADVEFSDVNLSLLSSFPDFTFGIDDLKVTGRGEFAGIDLVNAKSTAFELDIQSVINTDGPIEIHRVDLVDPKIHVIVARDGNANYDIAHPTTDTTSSEELSFLVELSSYTIQNGHFIYDDQLGNMYAELVDIDHSGKGNFTQDVFDLVTQTQIEGITFRFDGTNYLKKAKADMDVTLNIDNKNALYTFKENDIRLNALQLLMDGSVKLDWDAVALDLDIKAPQNEFKHLLSLIPSAYTADFSEVKTNGQFQLAGQIKGTYKMDGSGFPGVNMNLGISNADFQYPSLPLGMKDIQAQAKIVSPEGNNFDRIKVDLDRFHFQLGDNPFDLKLKLRQPISDPDIDTQMKGKINLADLSKALPMEGVKALEG